MQHKRESLRRRHCFQHCKQRKTDGIGEKHLMLRVEAILPTHYWFGDVGAQRQLPAQLSRTQHVKADTTDNRCKPSAEILNRVGVGPAKAEPGFLDGIVSLR